MADDSQSPSQDLDYTPPPHPYLHEPVLYISNLPTTVSDADLALALEHCVPFRPHIPRDESKSLCSGTIEFRLLDRGTPIRSVAR